MIAMETIFSQLMIFLLQILEGFTKVAVVLVEFPPLTLYTQLLRPLAYDFFYYQILLP